MSRLKDLGKVKDSFQIPIEKLIPDPNQPRADFNTESIATLANSLLLEGQHTPIVVRLSQDGSSAIIVHGERRWRSAKYAADELNSPINTLHAVAESKINGKVPTPDQRFVSQITDNDEQVGLSALERAKAYNRLIVEYKYTVTRVAGVVHRSDQHIRDMLKLLETPKDIQDAVKKGALSATAAVKTARARKTTQREVQEKLSAGEKVGIKDIDTAELDEDGKFKPLPGVEIEKRIRTADKNVWSARGKREKEKWVNIKYGLESALKGMHEW